MKKLINLSLAVIALSLMSSVSLKAMSVHLNYSKSDTTLDPKKHPGTINLDKHPEVMAKVHEDLRNGKIIFTPKNEGMDTAIDLDKHPELVKEILKDPSKWSVILKANKGHNDTLTVQGRNKQVIRDILAYLIKKHIIKERSDVANFLLTDKSFTVNGKKLPESLHAELKGKYIIAPDYVVYYGNSEMKGKGIFQRADNL